MRTASRSVDRRNLVIPAHAGIQIRRVPLYGPRIGASTAETSSFPRTRESRGQPRETERLTGGVVGSRCADRFSGCVGSRTADRAVSCSPAPVVAGLAGGTGVWWHRRLVAQASGGTGVPPVIPHPPLLLFSCSSFPLHWSPTALTFPGIVRGMGNPERCAVHSLRAAGPKCMTYVTAAITANDQRVASVCSSYLYLCRLS